VGMHCENNVDGGVEGGRQPVVEQTPLGQDSRTLELRLLIQPFRWDDFPHTANLAAGHRWGHIRRFTKRDRARQEGFTQVRSGMNWHRQTQTAQQQPVQCAGTRP